MAKLIFIIIDKLRLKFAAFYLLVGLIVWLAGGMPRGGWFMVVYFVGLVLVALWWLYRFISAPFRFLFGKKKTQTSASGSEVQIVTPPAPEAAPVFSAPQQPAPAPVTEAASQAPIRPRYFRVRQNPKYVMAEYPDRYELFFERAEGDWQYVRTDYKTYGDNVL